MSENVITLNAHDETAQALVATIRSATNGVGKYAAYAEAHEHLTHATVKHHALALAVLAYPNAKQVQTVTDETGRKTRTLFGNAVQAAGNGLRNALGAAEKAERPTDWLALLDTAVMNAHDKGEHEWDTIVKRVSDLAAEAGRAAQPVLEAV